MRSPLTHASGLASVAVALALASLGGCSSPGAGEAAQWAWLAARKPTPLQRLSLAAQAGDLAAVERLLARGVRPVGALGESPTPLGFAVQSRKLEIVQRLLDHGADPREDFDALLTAVRFAEVEIVRLLLDRGADPNQRARDLEPSASVPRPGGYGERDRQMVHLSPAEVSAEHITSTARRYDCGVSGHEPLLHHAAIAAPAEERGEQVLTLLLRAGANPNGRDLNGRTALTMPTAHAALLVAHGADSAITDLCGRTAAASVGRQGR